MTDSQPSEGTFRGGLVVFSGPSGCGKTSICKQLVEDPRVSLSVSATTRPPRPGEQEGVDYYFLSRKDFEQRIDRKAFVEWAAVHDNLYGTPREPLEEASTRRDRMMLLDIDVQGARQLRDNAVEAMMLFVAPPSLEALEQRLVGRGTDSREEIDARLAAAAQEMRHRDLYDHVLVNDDLESTIARVRSLLGL